MPPKLPPRDSFAPTSRNQPLNRNATTSMPPPEAPQRKVIDRFSSLFKGSPLPKSVASHYYSQQKAAGTSTTQSKGFGATTVSRATSSTDSTTTAPPSYLSSTSNHHAPAKRAFADGSSGAPSPKRRVTMGEFTSTLRAAETRPRREPVVVSDEEEDELVDARQDDGKGKTAGGGGGGFFSFAGIGAGLGRVINSWGTPEKKKPETKAPPEPENHESDKDEEEEGYQSSDGDVDVVMESPRTQKVALNEKDRNTRKTTPTSPKSLVSSRPTRQSTRPRTNSIEETPKAAAPTLFSSPSRAKLTYCSRSRHAERKRTIVDMPENLEEVTKAPEPAAAPPQPPSPPRSRPRPPSPEVQIEVRPPTYKQQNKLAISTSSAKVENAKPNKKPRLSAERKDEQHAKGSAPSTAPASTRDSRHTRRSFSAVTDQIVPETPATSLKSAQSSSLQRKPPAVQKEIPETPQESFKTASKPARTSSIQKASNAKPKKAQNSERTIMETPVAARPGLRITPKRLSHLSPQVPPPPSSPYSLPSSPGSSPRMSSELEKAPTPPPPSPPPTSIKDSRKAKAIKKSQSAPNLKASPQPAPKLATMAPVRPKPTSPSPPPLQQKPSPPKSKAKSALKPKPKPKSLSRSKSTSTLILPAPRASEGGSRRASGRVSRPPGEFWKANSDYHTVGGGAQSDFKIPWGEDPEKIVKPGTKGKKAATGGGGTKKQASARVEKPKGRTKMVVDRSKDYEFSDEED